MLNKHDPEVLCGLAELYSVPVQYIMDHSLFDPNEYPYNEITEASYLVLKLLCKTKWFCTDENPKEALDKFFSEFQCFLDAEIVKRHLETN